MSKVGSGYVKHDKFPKNSVVSEEENRNEILNYRRRQLFRWDVKGDFIFTKVFSLVLLQQIRCFITAYLYREGLTRPPWYDEEEN